MASSFAAILIVLFLGTSLLAWLAAEQRWAKGVPVVACESRRPVPWGLLDIGLTLLCLMVVLGLAMQFVFMLLGLHLGSSWKQLPVAQRALIMLIESSGNVVVVVLSLLWIRFRVGASLRDVGIVLDRLGADVRLGVRAFVMLAPPVYLLQWLLVQWFESKHPLVELLRREPDPWTIGISLFAAVIVAPIAEEYFFRGLLQGWLENVATQMRWRPAPPRIPPIQSQPNNDSGSAFPFAHDVSSSHWSQATERDAVNETELDTARNEAFEMTGLPGALATNPYRSPCAAGGVASSNDSPCTAIWPIVVSSLVFSLLHWSHGPDWVPLFFLALGLGYLYRQTHRIVPGIVVHFLLNSLSMGMFLMELVGRQAAR